ncbi:O-antigen ligase family protein [Mycolicibacterium flavescens]|uniref:O-antigen ligase family protein n=1 Tax=Mycolicibacterium flavescens TaxID=1776 RepID=UPI000AFD335A|nr:O-antigen ligase family protein [Mycolicibacterium flavescens]
MNPRGDLPRTILIGLAIVAVVPPIAWASMTMGRFALLGVVGLAGVAIAIYVGLRHPLWLFWALAFLTGALPFGQFPGVNLPFFLPLAFGVILAVYVHPRLARSMHPLEVATWALVVLSVISMLVTSVTITSIIMVVRWALVTLVAVALMRLSNEHLAKFGRLFVYGSLLNALFGLYIVVLDRDQSAFRYLQIFGYAPEYTAPRFAYSEGGAVALIRLGGTSVDPNGEGIALVAALAVSFVVFRGWQRVWLSGIIGLALLLTLSRASIFSVVVGFVLVLVFHKMRSRDRALSLAGLAAVVIAAAMTPSIRERFLSAFSSDDRGATDRIDSLREFPHTMSGHWWFGLGWDRPEYTDGNLAFLLNHVSNAPLMTIYRGGIFTGIAFVAVAVIGCVYGYRAIRSNSMPAAIFGGIFIGFCLVALQLDHPVAGSPPSQLKFAIMLAFLVYLDRERNKPPRHDVDLERDRTLLPAH